MAIGVLYQSLEFLEIMELQVIRLFLLILLFKRIQESGLLRGGSRRYTESALGNGVDRHLLTGTCYESHKTVHVVPENQPRVDSGRDCLKSPYAWQGTQFEKKRSY